LPRSQCPGDERKAEGAGSTNQDVAPLGQVENFFRGIVKQLSAIDVPSLQQGGRSVEIPRDGALRDAEPAGNVVCCDLRTNDLKAQTLGHPRRHFGPERTDLSRHSNHSHGPLLAV
jgi:hypothetical protein